MSEETKEQVTNEECVEAVSSAVAKNTKAKKVKKPENEIPRGQPKSNRPWKTPKTK